MFSSRESKNVSRRTLLRLGAASAASLPAVSLLIACGGDPEESVPTATPVASTATAGTSGATGNTTATATVAPEQAEPTATSGGSTPTGNPVQGGTAVSLAGQEGSHLIPSFSSFSTVIVPSAPFFNGPTKPGPDLGPVPDLAEAWEISDDSLDYVFTFRQDVTWHDGAPFTANDVKYTWEVIAHPDNTTAAQLYNFFSFVEGAPEYHDGLAEEISGVTVPDDYTVAVTLTEPSAPFLTVASNQFIIPQYILGETEVGKILETEYARAPIGTGPFKFEAWDAGVSIIGAAYDEHFAGRPKLDKVVYRMIPGADANTVITGLRSGEFNAASISLDTYDTLQGDPSVRTIIRPGRSNQYIEFNLVKPFFEDVRVRKALSYATNRQEIVDTIWKGRAKVYNSVFPYDWWPTKQDTTIFDNDPEQAAALLDEAGWVVGSDGIREKDGVKFSFIMHSINDDWPLVVQQQWKAVGVEFQHEYVDFPTLSTQYYTTGLFDAVALTIPYGLYTDPHYSLPGYFLSANNRNKYANPKSDELIIAAAATNDQEERQRLYYEWQEVIAQDVPHLWLGNPDTAFAYSANLVTPELASSYFEWREVKDWYYVE